MSMPIIDGIHHLKFAVADCDRSLDFYTRVFGVQRIERADHRQPDGTIYAYICEWPGLGTLIDLRYAPEHAAHVQRFDPVTVNVADREALGEWIRHLDREGARHSGLIQTALAWMLVVEDPDGRRIRLYTREKHGPELPGEKNHPWMQHR